MSWEGWGAGVTPEGLLRGRPKARGDDRGLTVVRGQLKDPAEAEGHTFERSRPTLPGGQEQLLASSQPSSAVYFL